MREQAYLKAKKKKRFDEMVSENQKQSQTNGEGKQDRKLFPMSGKYEFKPAAHSLCRKKILERRSWKKSNSARICIENFCPKNQSPFHRTGQCNEKKS